MSGAARAAEKGAAVAEILVGFGSCGIAAGAKVVAEALLAGLKEAGLPVPVSYTGCIGACHREPLVEVRESGGKKLPVRRPGRGQGGPHRRRAPGGRRSRWPSC